MQSTRKFTKIYFILKNLQLCKYLRHFSIFFIELFFCSELYLRMYVTIFATVINIQMGKQNRAYVYLI